MSEPIVWLTIFILSVFVGIEVISKVSSTLHTPLMSGANAIHGIILLGAILVSGYAQDTLQLVIGLIAVVLASVNMVGGFVVTDRMLQMFTRKRPPAGAGTPGPTGTDTPAELAPKRRFGRSAGSSAVEKSGPKSSRKRGATA